MKNSFCCFFAILLSLSFAFIVQGQDFTSENEEQVKSPNAPTYLDVSQPTIFSGTKCLGKNRNGLAFKRYLMIEYPWSKIQNATLEIRIIGPEAEKQPQFCKPLCFNSVYGKLERIDKDIFDKKIGYPRFRNDITYKRDLFHEYGLLEPESMELRTTKPLAGASADFFHVVIKNQEINELETTLVFHDLSQWAVDDERLALSLEGNIVSDSPDGRTNRYAEFSKPCKLKIWLLRDSIVVWEQTFQWPGTEKDNPQISAPKKPVSQNEDDDEDPRVSAKKMENSNKNQNNNDTEEADGDSDFEGFGDDNF